MFFKWFIYLKKHYTFFILLLFFFTNFHSQLLKNNIYLLFYYKCMCYKFVYKLLNKKKNISRTLIRFSYKIKSRCITFFFLCTIKKTSFCIRKTHWIFLSFIEIHLNIKRFYFIFFKKTAYIKCFRSYFILFLTDMYKKKKVVEFDTTCIKRKLSLIGLLFICFKLLCINILRRW